MKSVTGAEQVAMLDAPEVLDHVGVRRLPAYRNYAPCAIAGLRSLPAHWQIKPLKHIARINPEDLPDKTTPDYELTYVDIGNVDYVSGIVDTEDYCFEEAPSRARRCVKDGDTIISTVRTYLKAVAHIVAPPSNLIVSTGFAVLRPGADVDPAYLYRCVQADVFVNRVVAHSTGVSYPAIAPSDLGRFPVWLPPLDEQRTIAAFLDRETAKIDTLVAKKRRLIELLKEKRTALISHAVTKGLNPDARMKPSGVDWLGDVPEHWEFMPLKRICAIRGGQVDPRELEFAQMTLIAPDHIESQTGRLLLRETAADQGAISGKYMFFDGDVLYSKIRPELAKAVLANGEGLCSADMYALVPNQRSNARYLLRLLLSDVVTKMTVDESLRVAMPKVNRLTLGRIPLGVPPVAEQEEIAEYLDAISAQIDGLCDSVRAAVDRLHEYRLTLISMAVCGRIDVRGAIP